jgi:glucoamylase
MAYLRAYNTSHPTLWHREGGSKNPFADLYDAGMPANSIIKADLEYVARYWREPGFDLWEEMSGLHFFTALVQFRALREGADLAAAFGDWGAMKWYGLQADSLQAELLPRFWNAEKGYVVASLDAPERSGLDCGVLLGAIHGTAIGDENAWYAPYSDEILVTLLELVRDQRKRFPINAASLYPMTEDGERDELAGVGIGRYPEDEYDGYGARSQGGNPWFLCTASSSEVLYRTASHIVSTQILNVTSTSLPFWRAVLPSFNLDADTVYESGDVAYHRALKRLKITGDSFLDVVKKHADGEGALSEQFDRFTGYERGARDLTWSYAAFLQAVRARDALIVEEKYR